MLSQNNFISRIMYNLRMRFATPIALYHLSENSVNAQTGKRLKDYTVSWIPGATVIPQSEIIKIPDTGYKFGTFYDTKSRLVIFDKDQHQVSDDDYFIINGDKFKVEEINDNKDGKSYEILVKNMENQKNYDPDLETFLVTNNVGEYCVIVLDEYIIKIKNDIFLNVIPESFLFFQFVGNDFESSLKCLYHPDGIGTAITPHNFLETDFYKWGVRGGLHDMDKGNTKYLDLKYNLQDNLALDDFHISFYVSDLDEIGNIVGANDGSTSLGITSDGSKISAIFEETLEIEPSTLPDDGHVILTSTANNDLRLYFNGVLHDSSSVTRIDQLPNIDLFAFANNNNGTVDNIGNFNLKSITIGPGLTQAQCESLHTITLNYNNKLGRSL